MTEENFYDDSQIVNAIAFDENNDGILDNITGYKRDFLGRIVEVNLDFDGDNITDSKIFFEYDDQNRLIKKYTDKNQDGKIDAIEYYEAFKNKISKIIERSIFSKNAYKIFEKTWYINFKDEKYNIFDILKNVDIEKYQKMYSVIKLDDVDLLITDENIKKFRESCKTIEDVHKENYGFNDLTKNKVKK